MAFGVCLYIATAELTENFSAVLTIPPAATSQGITKGAADAATIDITDNDPVEVVFNPTQYTVDEGNGVVILPLNADKPASFDYTVQVETQDGTATGNLECYIILFLCYLDLYKFQGLVLVTLSCVAFWQGRVIQTSKVKSVIIKHHVSTCRGTLVSDIVLAYLLSLIWHHLPFVLMPLLDEKLYL